MGKQKENAAKATIKNRTKFSSASLLLCRHFALYVFTMPPPMKKMVDTHTGKVRSNCKREQQRRKEGVQSRAKKKINDK